MLHGVPSYRSYAQVLNLDWCIEAANPDSLLLIMGDFSTFRLSKSLPTFQQYVKCPTRGSKTLDLCYGNVRNSYKAFKKPPIGTADHYIVHLIPAYRTLVQREEVLKRSVKQWDNASIQTLQACFEFALIGRFLLRVDWRKPQMW